MSKIDDLIKQYCPDGVRSELIAKVCKIKTGSTASKKLILANPGKFPVINSGREPLGYINKWNTENDPIGITSRGAGVCSITWCEGKYYRGNLNYSCTVINEKTLSIRYLFYLLNDMQDKIQSLATYDAIPALNKENLEKLKIPIPPLAVQEEIVRILDTFTQLEAELEAELEARQQQYRYYRDQLLSFGGGVEWMTLEDVTLSISAGGDLPKKYLKGQKLPTKEFPYPIYSNGINEKSLYGFTDSYKIDSEAVTISARGAMTGWHTVCKEKFTAIVRLIVLIPNTDIILNKFLDYILYITEISHSCGSIPQLTVPNVKKIKIPIPPLAEQQRIVAILDKFDALVNDITSGLPAEINARRQQYEYYRNKLLTFKPHKDC